MHSSKGFSDDEARLIDNARPLERFNRYMTISLPLRQVCLPPVRGGLRVCFPVFILTGVSNFVGISARLALYITATTTVKRQEVMITLWPLRDQYDNRNRRLVRSGSSRGWKGRDRILGRTLGKLGSSVRSLSGPSRRCWGHSSPPVYVCQHYGGTSGFANYCSEPLPRRYANRFLR
jgi:hypothetical protein